MAKQEQEIVNKVEKHATQSGSADSIDRIELLKAGTAGGGRDKGGEPQGGGGKFLEMTDPFAKPAGGDAQGGKAPSDKHDDACQPGGGGGRIKMEPVKGPLQKATGAAGQAQEALAPLKH